MQIGSKFGRLVPFGVVIGLLSSCPDFTAMAQQAAPVYIEPGYDPRFYLGAKNVVHDVPDCRLPAQRFATACDFAARDAAALIIPLVEAPPFAAFGHLDQLCAAFARDFDRKTKRT